MSDIKISNLFNIINEHFFNVLTQKNKGIFIDSISFLFNLIDELDDDNNNNRYEIENALSVFLENRLDDKIYDDNGEEIVELKSRYIINRLINSGWLFEESIGNNVYSLNFYEHAYKIIRLLYEISKQENLQYTGYVKIILNAFDNFHYDSIDDFEIVTTNIDNLVSMLKTLRSNINRYYSNILKNKSKDQLTELLTKIMDYKNNVFDTVYYKLKTEDMVLRYIPEIKNRCEELYANDVKKQLLVKAMMNEKDFEFDYKAETYVNDKIYKALKDAESIPNIMNQIDSKNNKYISSCMNKILYLIKRGEDIEGLLNRMIEITTQNNVIPQFTNIFDVDHYSWEDLSKPRESRTKIAPQKIILDSSFDKEIIDSQIKQLQKESEYNLTNVNKYIDTLLLGKDEIHSSNIEVISNYQYTMIVAILLYCTAYDAIYEVEPSEGKTRQNDVTFRNFIIRRKVKC